MSKKRCSSPRRLERFRAKVTLKGKAKEAAVQTPGRGHKVAREARVQALREALQLKKKSGKMAAQLEALDASALQEKLNETRKELFSLRMQHATGQLEKVAKIPAAKREIARILTLMKQKEVGA